MKPEGKDPQHEAPAPAPASGVASSAAVTEIDTAGLACPLPVLRLRKALADAAPGARLRLIATDPMARIDIPHLCETEGHRVALTDDQGDCLVFDVQKAGGSD